MLCEPLFKKLYAKMGITNAAKNLPLRVLRHIRTLVIILVGETIFGANDLSGAFTILSSVFRPYHGSVFSLGLDAQEWVIALVGMAAMLGVGIVKERGIEVRASVAKTVLPVRWSVYLAMTVFIALFGAYGDLYAVVPFIYGNF